MNNKLSRLTHTYLDRSEAQRVRDNYLKLNRYRLDFAQKTLPENQRHFLKLLPALFHFNHPMLPGYCDPKAPAGVYDYQTNDLTLKRLKQLAKSFTANTTKNQDPDILSIFTMGSIGSLAQNHQSDVDIWLCYRTDLSQDRLLLLEEKAKKISLWAENLGVDTTIFLMNHQAFSQGKIQALDKESSGSTQHHLLLDEFYRTALLIAGQLPAWLFTTQHSPLAYKKEIQTLIKEKRLSDCNIIDFGALNHIPSGEFVSAAIWQLYKAIHSPYKAIIKLLLIEIYVAHNHPSFLLANEFKSWLQSETLLDKANIELYDPYYNTYKIIESYLKKTKQPHRLELVRRSFYFKITQDKTIKKNIFPAEKQRFIKRMIRDWGWNKDTIHEIDNHKQWKVNRVNRERHLIYKALNDSYYFIIDFLRKEDIALSASNKELNILGRKLTSAFSKQPGKVDWLNPGISEDIREENIFISKINEHTWTAKNHKNETLLSKKSLIELIVNCHCNHIITTKTRIHLSGKNSFELDKFQKVLRNKIPNSMKQAEHECFTLQASISKAFIFIHSLENTDTFLANDPTQQTTYFLNQICNIDIVIINSWNEIKCQQLKGKTDEVIPRLLSQFINDIDFFDICECFVFDGKAEKTINTYINNLSSSIKQCFSQHQYSRLLLKNNREFIFLNNTPNNQYYSTYSNTDELKKALNKSHNVFCTFQTDASTLKETQWAVFAKYNRKNSIQIFFEARENLADVTIVDEQGSFYFLTINYENFQTSLLPLYTYCRSVNERRLNHNMIETSPLDIQPISIYELRTHKGYWQANQRYLNNQATIEDQFTLNGVAEFKNNDFIFTLYCEEKCFSEADEQAKAFKKMLRWMRAQSNQSNKPPRYFIADLDISQCQMAFISSDQPHTVHYLQVKSVLEHKLKHAFG